MAVPVLVSKFIEAIEIYGPDTWGIHHHRSLIRLAEFDRLQEMMFSKGT